MQYTALLALAEGTIFWGRSIGAPGMRVGEVVFNTAMTGYQEILTDPSYFQQIVTLTYPHIGNVGVNEEDFESTRIYASGLVVRDVPRHLSNWRSQQDLRGFLRSQGCAGITDIDTRKLTRIIRDQGAQNACLMAGDQLDPQEALKQARTFPGLKGMDLAKEVSTAKSYVWDEGLWCLPTAERPAPSTSQYRVVAYDFGIKRNILRHLVSAGCQVTVVPAQTPAQEVLAMKPQGVFLSNGPGDPEPCDYAIAAIQQIARSGTPVFGICLGHQLLGLAAGAKTVKMKFGHHGANHPVIELATAKVLISSQNHGFAVDEATLPARVKATHRSLFDGSLQGLSYNDYPVFSFQGHPEASPGPHDIAPLFARFIALMRDEL